MKIGIVGLPNVGKSTLFNSITKAGAESANYPFTTIEPNVGIATVPDERLDVLLEIYNSKKKLPAIIEFVDIAGLVRGASKGEGLGNQFLSHIREVDSIVQVLRCFEDDNITHVDGSIDPIRDIETIRLELIYSDLIQVERKLAKSIKALKSDKKMKFEVDTLEKVKNTLNEGISAKNMDLNKEELEIISDLFLLSIKPEIFVANIEENNLLNPENNKQYLKLKEYAENEETELIPLCIKVEEELSELDDEDKKIMLEELGLFESGLDKLIKSSYSLLGLMSFLTAGEQEIRAWTIKKGTAAPEAAGKIHTDIQRGFIKAEVVSYDELVEAGNIVKAKEKGLVRLEGKEYIMKEGDIALFRFNV